MVKKIGTNGNDNIAGTGNADELWGRGGNDSISGSGGHDYMHGEGGNDSLYGGGGNDRMWGGTGIDALFGQDGDDQLYGEAGDDYMDGGIGNDFLHGGAGNDRLRGGDGNDVLNSGGGNDDVRGGNGNDTLIVHEIGSSNVVPKTSYYEGGSGNDTLTLDLHGQFSNQFGDTYPWVQAFVGQDRTGSINLLTDADEGFESRIGTHSGIETFRMGASDGKLDFTASTSVTAYGGAGNDRLEGRQGDQTFIGGGGADEFRFLWRDGMENGHDRVVGFDPAEDMLLFSVNNFQGENDQHITFTSRVANGHTIITLTGDDDGHVYNTVDVDAIGIQWSDGYFIG